MAFPPARTHRALRRPSVQLLFAITLPRVFLFRRTDALALFVACCLPHARSIEVRHLNVSSPFAKSLPEIEVTLLTNKTLEFPNTAPQVERTCTLRELDWKIPADFTRYNNLVIEFRADFAQPFDLILHTPSGAAKLGLSPYQNVWSRGAIPLRGFSQFPEAPGSGGDIGAREGVGFVGLLTSGPWHSLTRVQRLTLAMTGPVHSGRLEIRSMKLTTAETEDEVLEKEILVDELLQWKRADWPGKPKTLSDLKTAWDAEATALQPLDAGYTKFGGYAALPTRQATGFYRTEWIDGKWWFVTPEGHPFYSVGLNFIDPRVEAPYDGLEFIFATMPPKEKLTNPEETDFDEFMLERRFGKDWEKTWTARALQRMPAWGFNTAGCWALSSIKDAKQIPYCQFLTSWGRFDESILDLYKLYVGLPDVYHPKFAEAADKNAGPRCGPRKVDPWLIGYFVTNSPPFSGREEITAERIPGGPATATRLKLESWLAPSETPAPRRAFLWQMYDDYLAIVTAANRRHDPNHLIIGMRFADDPFSDELLRASRHLDVFSYAAHELNAETQDKIRRIARVTGRPVLLDSFNFGAPARGLSGGFVTVRDQTERGVGYRHFVENAAAMPEVVGTHFSRWSDDPAWGNDDGQNRNSGVLARHRDAGVHMRACWIFTRSDVIANAGVIFAGALVRFTGASWPDVLIGALLTILVFRGGLEILRDAGRERLRLSVS